MAEVKSKKTRNPYQKLIKIFAQVKNLYSISNLMNWDSVAKMPQDATKARAEMLTTLANLRYSILSSNATSSLIKDLENNKSSLSLTQLHELNLMKSHYAFVLSRPPELMSEMEQSKVECYAHWVKAREQNSFTLVEPHLKKLVSLISNAAVKHSEILKRSISPYNTLLDSFELGIRTDIFEELVENDLQPFILETLPKVKPIKTHPIKSSCTQEAQKKIFKMCQDLMFVQQDRITIDTAIHPSCHVIAEGEDIRLIMKDDEQIHPIQFIKTAMHELGHANLSLRCTNNIPNGPAMNMGSGLMLHESQALMFENHISGELPFIAAIQPNIKSILKTRGKSWEPINIFNTSKAISNSLVRVQSDELKYHLHIIMRKKLEYQILQNHNSIKDLPQHWETLSMQFFNEKPKNNLEGCLQDVHWYFGYFGYFPLYSLGAIASAQIFEHVVMKDKTMMDNIAKGNLQPLITHVQDTLYKNANKLPVMDLIKDFTGKPLDTESYKKYITTKYLS